MPIQSWPDRLMFLLHVHSLGLSWLLCTCHSPLLAQRQRSLTNPAYMQEVAEQIDSLIESKYVLPERAAEHAAAFRSKYTSGEYASFTNPTAFAEKVTADLIELTGDSHFNLRVIEPSALGESTESVLRHPVRFYQLGRREHLGFFRLDWLEGNVGVLDLRRFYPISESKQMVDAAMLFLSTADAIIIDVRENGGGAGESLPYFCSYFLESPTQLSSYYSREEDFLTEFWTTAEVSGRRRTDVPIFVLTSERTFSAAEIFAYDMQAVGRATLVGDSTGGGAHSVDLYKIDDLFEIYIPTARAINPVTLDNWEGTGVIPDVLVAAEAALDTALVLARAAAQEYGALEDDRVRVAIDRMQRLLSEAEALFRAKRNEEADVVLDSMFLMGQEVGIINEFFIDVLSYNYFGGLEEEILYAILNKKVELYPKSPTAWEALASAYASNDKNESAIECYRKVLELNPDDPNAVRMIERLGGW